MQSGIIISKAKCVTVLIVLAAAIASCSGGGSDGAGPTDMPEVDMSSAHNITVDATSNIYLSDLLTIPVLESGAGTLPPSYSIASQAGQILTIVSATGAISCCTTRAATTEPDGRESSGGARIDPFMGFSGIIYLKRGMFLTAVFTSSRDVDSTPPVTLDYSIEDPNSVVEFFPEINQVFFVGDGRTVDGTTQSFYVPEGAANVHFGTVDGSNFVGTSNHFDDNHGAFQISIRVE